MPPGVAPPGVPDPEGILKTPDGIPDEPPPLIPDGRPQLKPRVQNPLGGLPRERVPAVLPQLQQPGPPKP
jgi:hypothetical protein